MQNLNLREAILQIVQNKSNEELTDVIADSIGGDERALPGLGVLFELIWQHSDASEQSKMVATLHSHLHDGIASTETEAGAGANPSPS
ncbi:small acid-soluble spore protein SspI [Paenibacillus sp. GCM10027626]|uniref:small acid-soluble spore protein SspI n=1 Tax=Paenibacillus sp. GCM10027626 TaxID=3273411 RepID=UPI0036407186